MKEILQQLTDISFELEKLNYKREAHALDELMIAIMLKNVTPNPNNKEKDTQEFLIKN